MLKLNKNLLERVRYEEASRSFYVFSREIFQHHYQRDLVLKSFHVAIIGLLELFVEKSLKRQIINTMPQVGKSEFISRLLPAFILGVNPNAKIIAVSYSQELASNNNRDVQKIMDSKIYKAIFPNTKLPSMKDQNYQRTSKQFDIVGYSGSYFATGIDGSITGKSCDYLIIDDIIKGFEDAISELNRNKVWNFFISVANTRLDKDGSILITMTRWHEDDLVGRLLKR